MGNACSGICSSQGTGNFVVNISREENLPLGIEFDDSDGYSVRLSQIEMSGSFAKWNRGRCMEQVRRGDHIIAVNGVRGSASGILRRMQQAKELNMDFYRPAAYSIEVTKTAGGLGIDTKQSDNSRSLMISHVVGKGAVKEWNDAHPDKQVRKYDRIVKVNGCPGTVEELRQKIMAAKDGQKLGLTLMVAAPRGEGPSASSPATVASDDASLKMPSPDEPSSPGLKDDPHALKAALSD